MHKSLLTTVVDEKHILRYLNSIAPAEYESAQSLLSNCIGYGILTAILPFYEPERHLEIAKIIAQSDEDLQKKWLAQQPMEVKLSIRETVERIFLSLQ